MPVPGGIGPRGGRRGRGPATGRYRRCRIQRPRGPGPGASAAVRPQQGPVAGAGGCDLCGGSPRASPRRTGGRPGRCGTGGMEGVVLCGGLPICCRVRRRCLNGPCLLVECGRAVRRVPGAARPVSAHRNGRSQRCRHNSGLEQARSTCRASCPGAQAKRCPHGSGSGSWRTRSLGGTRQTSSPSAVTAVRSTHAASKSASCTPLPQPGAGRRARPATTSQPAPPRRRLPALRPIRIEYVSSAAATFMQPALHLLAPLLSRLLRLLQHRIQPARHSSSCPLPHNASRPQHPSLHAATTWTPVLRTTGSPVHPQ